MSSKSSLLDTAPAKSLMDATSNEIQGSVYLLRHGRTALDVQHRSDGWLDLPLSDKGQLSLIPAQQYLKTIPISCIYAPELKRTHETAKIIASGTLSSPEVEKANEAKTWNLGVLAGTPKEESKPKVQMLMASPSQRPLGGESYDEFTKRFIPWFTDTAAEAVDDGKPILIVCSGSNLRAIGSMLFNNYDLLDLDEGGLAVLHNSDGNWHEEIIFGDEDASGYTS